MSEYENILDLKHFEPSSKHPRMTLYKRSAQFAPFAALSGYSEQINETKRLTTRKIELSDDKKEEINNNLSVLLSNNNLIAKIIYFLKDKYKSGGKYISISGKIMKYDDIKRFIVLENKQKISIDNIVDLSIENLDIK